MIHKRNKQICHIPVYALLNRPLPGQEVGHRGQVRGREVWLRWGRWQPGLDPSEDVRRSALPVLVRLWIRSTQQLA